MVLTDAHKGYCYILAMAGKPVTVFANASAAVPACGLLCENVQRLPDLKGCLAFVFWMGSEDPGLSPNPLIVSCRGLTHPFVVPRLDRGIQFAIL